jgi:hypothetical protein
MKQLRELPSQTDTANHDEETPSMVQSIQSPRQAKESIHDLFTTSMPKKVRYRLNQGVNQ